MIATDQPVADVAIVGGAPTAFIGETRRLHPLTLLLAIARIGPQSVNMLPAAVALGVTGQARYIIPAILAYLAISLLFGWLRWSRFSWQVDEDDVTISSGILSRQQRVIPFDRIQDVSIEQRLLHRLLGLAKVGFETGSAGGDEGDDGKLDAIALADAESVRRHIRERRTVPLATAGAGTLENAGEAAVAQVGDDRVIFAMGLPRLITAGLFNFSLAIFAIIGGLLSQADNFLNFDFNPFDVDVYRDLAQSLGLDDWVLAHRWVSAIGGVAVLLVVGALTGVIRTVIRDKGFTLERTARGFRRRRGLTTITDVTIPVARVQAAILSTGWVRRLFGWYELRLQSLAGDGANESDHLVAPLATLAEIDAILTELGLERAGFEETRAVRRGWHRSHVIGAITGPLPLLIIGVALLIVGQLLPTNLYEQLDIDPRFAYVGLVPLMLSALIGLFAYGAWFNRRWFFDGRVLHIATGLTARRHILLPARNIQSADISIGPVDRRLALADLKLGIPGGASGQHAIMALRAGEARDLRGALLAVR